MTAVQALALALLAAASGSALGCSALSTATVSIAPAGVATSSPDAPHHAAARTSPLALHPVWARRLGGAGEHDIGGVAVDRAGNIAIAGTYTAADFGAGPLPAPPADESAAFVLLLDDHGKLLWSRGLGFLTPFHVPLVAMDAEGDVILAGSFEADIDLGTGPLVRASTTDVFVAKLDPSGKTLWAKSYGGPYFQKLDGLAVDPSGNVILAGNFVDTGPDFGHGALHSAGSSDAFVAELDPGGNTRWVRTFGGPGADRATSAAADDDGDVYLTGTFTGSIDLGRGPLHGTDPYDLFVAKLDRNGRTAWSHRIGARDRNDVFAAAVSPTGTFAFAGFRAAGGTYTTALDPSGTLLYDRRLRPRARYPLALDAAGNTFTITSSLDTERLTVTATSRTGEDVWTGQLGTILHAHVEAAMDRRSSTLIVAGHSTVDPLDMGTGPVPASNGELFVVALSR